MNLENLQKQIDSRCPCFALPLEECKCQFNENESDLDNGTCDICNIAINSATTYRAYGCKLCQDCFNAEMY